MLNITRLRSSIADVQEASTELRSARKQMRRGILLMIVSLVGFAGLWILGACSYLRSEDMVAAVFVEDVAHVRFTSGRTYWWIDADFVGRLQSATDPTDVVIGRNNCLLLGRDPDSPYVFWLKEVLPRSDCSLVLDDPQ